MLLPLGLCRRRIAAVDDELPRPVALAPPHREILSKTLNCRTRRTPASRDRFTNCESQIARAGGPGVHRTPRERRTGSTRRVKLPCSVRPDDQLWRSEQDAI